VIEETIDVGEPMPEEAETRENLAKKEAELAEKLQKMKEEAAKSLDPELTIPALWRFLELLKETCPNLEIVSECVDLNNSISDELKIKLDFLYKLRQEDIFSYYNYII
jgi:hypothetical protein